MYTKTVCATNFGPFGELALIFLYNFQRDHILLKLKIKKLLPKISVKSLKLVFNQMQFQVPRLT